MQTKYGLPNPSPSPNPNPNQTKYGLLDNLSKYAYTKAGEFDAPGTDDSHGDATLTQSLTLTLIRNLP